LGKKIISKLSLRLFGLALAVFGFSPNTALAIAPPYMFKEYLMTQMGFNYQWLLFNYLSSPLNALFYVALALAVIGGLAILIVPRFQKLTVIVPYLVLALIVLVGPYQSSIFFNNVSVPANEFVVPGDNTTMEKHDSCNSGSGACTNVAGAQSTREATGQVDVIARLNAMGLGMAADDVYGFAPQTAIIHFANKAQNNIKRGLMGLGPGKTQAVLAQAKVKNSDEFKVDDTAMNYHKSLFQMACPAYAEQALVRTDVPEIGGSVSAFDILKTWWGDDSDTMKSMGWQYFTLRDARNLNDYYYAYRNANKGALVYPVRAEGLVAYVTRMTTTDLFGDTATHLANNNAWYADLDSEAFLGSPQYNQSPLRNQLALIQRYYDNSNSSGADVAKYSNNIIGTWLRVYGRLLNEGFFPDFIYREPEGLTLNAPPLATAGTNPNMTIPWSLASMTYDGDIITKEYLDSELDTFDDYVWDLPVALRIPAAGENIPGDPYRVNASYDSRNEYSYRVTNCAEFHMALEDRYLDKVEQERDMPVALTQDSTNPAVNVNNNGTSVPIDVSSPFSEALSDLSTAADGYIDTALAIYSFLPTPGNMTKWIANTVLDARGDKENQKNDAGAMDTGLEMAAFSGFSTGVATVAEFLGGWVMEMISWFVGVAAQLFVIFAMALANYGIALTLMITPFIYLVGLAVPGWSMQVLLAPLAAIMYFKAVSISFIIIDFVIGNMKLAEDAIYSSGTIEHALYTFIAAAAYMAAFGLAGFLLFGLGSAGGLVQHLGGKMDASAGQGAGALSRAATTGTVLAGSTLASGGTAFGKQTVKGAIEAKKAGATTGGALKHGLNYGARTGLKEGADVFRGAASALKRVPVVGAAADEVFNAWGESDSTAKTLKAQDAGARIRGEGSMGKRYGKVMSEAKKRQQLQQNATMLRASGDIEGAFSLQLDSLSTLSPGDQNFVGRNIAKQTGNSSSTIPVQGKDSKGENQFIDSFFDSIESGSTINKIADARGIKDKDAAKQEVFKTVGEGMIKGNLDKEPYKTFSKFSDVAEEDIPRMTKDENGNDVQAEDKTGKKLWIARKGDVIGGFAVSDRYKNDPNNNYNEVSKLLDQGEAYEHKFTNPKTGQETFITGSYTPRNAAEARKAVDGSGDDTPPTGGGAPTRPSGGAPGGDGADSRDNPASPAKLDVDGKQLGREMADGFNERLKDMGDGRLKGFGNQYEKQGGFYLTSKDKAAIDEMNKPNPDKDES
jgi:hypothetical protein